jgi:hypothetical protein
MHNAKRILIAIDDSDASYRAVTYVGSIIGGAKGTLPSFADKLLFILAYQKTNPLQVMHGRQCALSQSQTNHWMHRLLLVLQNALREMGYAPEREAQRVETSALALAGAPNLAVDGTERRRQPATAARIR